MNPPPPETSRCPHCGGSVASTGGVCLGCLAERAFGGDTIDPSPESGDAVPRRLGDYEVLEPLGRGGMGTVYLARHVELNRLVALKVIAGGALATAEAESRFMREAQTTARLAHPNIVSVHTAGRGAGRLYYAMDLVEGRDLGQACAGRPLAPRAAAELLLALARAVQHAHERGIVHRDLKPANVLLDAAGTPRIADFGLARWTFEPAELTRPGQVLGSPAFMAPEQAEGVCAPAVDVYGLGAVLFFALTGRAPVSGSSALEVFARLAREPLPPPSTLRAEIPAALDAVCLRCLAFAPADRYPSAAALAEELGRWLAGENVLAPFPPAVAARRLVEEVRADLAAHAYEPQRCAAYAEKLGRAAELDPRCAAAHVELARLHLHYFNSNMDPSPGRKETATLALERAEALAPGAADTRAARILFRLTIGGECAEAWPDLRALIDERRDDPTLQIAYLRTGHRLGKWPEALASARALVRRPDRWPVTRQLLAYSLYLLRDYADAAVWMDEAAKLDGAPMFRRLAVAWYGWLADPEPTRALRQLRALPEHAQGLRTVRWCECQVLLTERRFAEALASYRSGETDTSSTLETLDCTVYQLRLERWAGDRGAAATEEKLRALLAPGRQKAVRHPYDMLVAAYACAVLGRRAEALALADEGAAASHRLGDAVAVARLHGANEFFAMPGRLVILALCDERERFFAEFARLLDEPAALDLRYLAMDPTFDALRADPRFDALLAAAQMPIRPGGPAIAAADPSTNVLSP